ncbi:hypothetical protein Taro_054522, partial [Colocasia esculenta]|nr:hypothetical protein [Colocasia esculenta]
LAPDRWFCNPFLGAICGGTDVWFPDLVHIRGPEWFCLWALDLVVHAEGCFRMFSDSAVFARVVSGRPWLWVVALLCRDSLSQEFVAGWLWWRFVAPCVASSVS